MTPEDQAQFDALKAELQELKTQMKPLLDIRIDESSGGGRVTYGDSWVTITPWSGTPSGSQI